jgi:hypothetical protein
VFTHSAVGGAELGLLAALLPEGVPRPGGISLRGLVFFGPLGGGRRPVGMLSLPLGLGELRWEARRASRSGTIAFEREDRKGE